MKWVICVVLQSCYLTGAYAESLSGTHSEVKLSASSSEFYESNKKSLKVVVEDLDFPEGPQKEYFIQALDLVELVLNSDRFHKEVLSYQNPQGKFKYQRNYLWNDSQTPLTNRQILDVILRAEEGVGSQGTDEVNLYVRVKSCNRWSRWGSSWCRNVIASTTPMSSAYITLNWKFYSKMSPPEMVGNIVHEWLHLLGFLHSKKNKSEDVSYDIGAIAEKLAKQYSN